MGSLPGSKTNSRLQILGRVVKIIFKELFEAGKDSSIFEVENTARVGFVCLRKDVV